MELSVDKRLEIDKPLEPIYLFHKPHPVKVIDTALSKATKADKIAKKTTETGKVTAVVAVMSIFKQKRCKLRSASLGMRGLLAKRQKEPIFRRKIPADHKAFLKN